MYERTRLRLTAWYLLIIMLITVLFSMAFYQATTREIQRLIDRVEFEQRIQEAGLFRPQSFQRVRIAPSIEELKSLKTRSFVTLVIINGLILIFAGGAGYFLAGITLKPIKLMIDEQNIFISNASHELRTPLATLRAEMEGSLLEQKLSDKKIRTLIKSNLEEVSTLQELSNKLLKLTQLHNFDNTISFEQISLKKIITAAQKKVLSLQRQKHISVSLEVEDILIQAAPSSLVEAFVVILDNAIKYSAPKTTINITSQRNAEYVSISITDQGSGIDEKDLSHVFERFYRADKSRSKVDGYGLGLSIAKKIIEAHSGYISANSIVGQGTTFIVHLPTVKD